MNFKRNPFDFRNSQNFEIFDNLITLKVSIFCQYFLMNPTFANDSNFKFAVTTSFHNSGLSDVLIPNLERDTGLIVDLLVVGTGLPVPETRLYLPLMPSRVLPHRAFMINPSGA